MESADVPEKIRRLFEARNIPADFDVDIKCKPPWFDRTKYKRGQTFAKQHFFCLSYAELLSLISIFAVKTSLEPIIFTKKSETPEAAVKRYISTLTKLLSWYEGDMWEEGTKANQNLKTVRGMHKNVHNRMMACDNDSFVQATTIVGCPIVSLTRENMLKDIHSSCPFSTPAFENIKNGNRSINQVSMFGTQFAFVGLVITFPQRFGIHNAVDEDLEAYMHLWRCLGYVLGLKDEYNFCGDDLQEARLMTMDVIQHLIKPSFRELTPEWEHMTRCIIEGLSAYLPGITYNAFLRDIYDLFEITTPRFTNSMTYYENLVYYLIRFNFNILLRCPGLIAIINKMMIRIISTGKNLK